jgi:hypothetical protein
MHYDEIQAAFMFHLFRMFAAVSALAIAQRNCRSVRLGADSWGSVTAAWHRAIGGVSFWKTASG